MSKNAYTYGQYLSAAKRMGIDFNVNTIEKKALKQQVISKISEELKKKVDYVNKAIELSIPSPELLSWNEIRRVVNDSLFEIKPEFSAFDFDESDSSMVEDLNDEEENQASSTIILKSSKGDTFKLTKGSNRIVFNGKNHQYQNSRSKPNDDAGID